MENHDQNKTQILDEILSLERKARSMGNIGLALALKLSALAYSIKSQREISKKVLRSVEEKFKVLKFKYELLEKQKNAQKQAAKVVSDNNGLGK